jgi:acyl-CoA synthetase (AMP-forming)/AMP-acid ligase II
MRQVLAQCQALWQQVQDLTAALAAYGVTRGERVGVVLPDGPEMAVALLGAAAGTACAPLNPPLSKPPNCGSVR